MSSHRSFPIDASQLRDYECIEYPGFISDKGSIEELKSALDNIKIVKNSLSQPTLEYAPIQDVSGRTKISVHPQKRNFLLLKLERNRSTGKIQSSKIEGVIRTLHAFRELFDFTAISEDGRNIENLLNSALKSFDSEGIHRLLNALEAPVSIDSFLLPPHKFSHLNLPLSSRDLRTTLKLPTKSLQSRLDKSWNISFGETAIPSSPTEECILRASNIPHEQIDVIRKIFDERPIVSKLYLQNKIQDPEVISNLKYILPLIAYHWRNGPWHLLWTRLGVDPRSDSNYRFYQSIELRNKMFAKELRRGKSANALNQSNNTGIPSLSAENIGPKTFCFDGETLVLNYFSYQYCDLTYPPLMEIVNYPGGIRSSVSDREGWYPDGTARRLRDVMKEKWFELLKSMDLSALPSHKLEEILEIAGPDLVNLDLGLSLPFGNELVPGTRMSKTAFNDEAEDLNIGQTSFTSAENAADEEDDYYEIFDY